MKVFNLGNTVTKNEFSKKLNLKFPLVVAPMAGGPTSPELVIASSEAGVLGSIGAAYYNRNEIEEFISKVRLQTQKPVAINLFIPHEEPQISESLISRAIKATEKFRQQLNLPQPSLLPPYEENFDEQFDTVLKLKPKVFSFVFGLLKPEYVQAARKEGILLIGTATTLEEALALQESKVDAITLQGFEAGGHRGIFNSTAADSEVSLLNLIDQCRDKIKIPLIAAGGLMNSNDIKAVLSRGAHAVQLGTAFLACKEAATSAPYRKALLATPDRRTKTTRVFSGRFARGIENLFMQEMEKHSDAILPFPAQNKFTRDIRGASLKNGLSGYLSLWAGTGQGELWTGSAGELIQRLFLT